MALLWNPKFLCCDSPTGACRKLQTASFSHPWCFLHQQVCWSCGPSFRAACTTAWTCLRAISCSGPHAKLLAFHSINMQARAVSTPRCGMCCLQNSKGPTRHSVPSNAAVILQKTYHSLPLISGPLKSVDYWTFIGLISRPLDLLSYQGFQCTSHFLVDLSNQQ